MKCFGYSLPRFRACLFALVLLVAPSVFADADVAVFITSSPNPVTQGDTSTYTINVTNAGPTTATGVLLTSELSQGQTLVSGGPSSVCPDPGPLAWWRAENNANDSAGADKGTLISDAMFTTGAGGKVGEAFSLDGVGDYISFNTAMTPASFTLEGWFKPADANSLQVLVSKTVGDSFNDSFAIFISAGHMNALVPNGVGGFDIVTDPSTLTAGEWYHVAYTYNDSADSHVLYVNGVAVASGTATASLPYDSHPVLIGADMENGVADFFYSGLADEVTIYDYALSASVLLDIYNSHNAGKCNPSSPIVLGDLPGQTAINITLTVVTTICTGTVTNIVHVTSTTSDPNLDDNVATGILTVVDMTDPTIVDCPINIIVSNDAGECAAVVSWIEPTVSDNCPGPSLTQTAGLAHGSPFPLGTTAVTYEATDAGGNIVICSFTVTVEDGEVPTITCVASKEAECGSAWSFDSPTVSDACGSTAVAVLSTVTNNADFCGQTFEATRTWEATDLAGNKAQCSQKVTLVDTIVPTITCAANKTAECGSAWSFDTAISSDGCGGTTLTILSTVTNSTGPCTLEATRTW